MKILNTSLSDVNEASEDDDIHQGIECDGCEMNPIHGLRYHCLDCPDYDLCEGCYNKEVHSQHKMKRKSAKGLMYHEEKSFL